MFKEIFVKIWRFLSKNNEKNIVVVDIRFQHEIDSKNGRNYNKSY